MKPEVPLQVETVTPAMAKRFLDTMIQNRKLTDEKIVRYGLRMDADDWALNGETLKFNAEGRMIDGQHRCHACILANKPFKTYMAFGVADPRAFATIDTHGVRTTGDIFSIAGIGDANNVSAAATRIYQYKHGMLTVTGTSIARGPQFKKIIKGTRYKDATMSRVIDKQELLTYSVPILPQLVESVRIASASKASKLIPLSMAGALHFLFNEKDPLAADEFIRDLGKGAGLAENDPVHALRNKLIAHMGGHAKLALNAKMLLCIVAWNKRRAGEKSKILKLVENPIFPKIH